MMLAAQPAHTHWWPQGTNRCVFALSKHTTQQSPSSKAAAVVAVATATDTVLSLLPAGAAAGRLVPELEPELVEPREADAGEVEQTGHLLGFPLLATSAAHADE